LGFGGAEEREASSTYKTHVLGQKRERIPLLKELKSSFALFVRLSTHRQFQTVERKKFSTPPTHISS
jgi:hypothetical protein